MNSKINKIKNEELVDGHCEKQIKRKHEYSKQEKDIYGPKTTPQLITIPKFKFLCIKGKGNPNNDDFTKRITTLYSLSYAIKMMPRNGYTPKGYFEYTVYPLEGLWDLTDEGRKQSVLNKDELVYTIMIRQPDFVDQSVLDYAFSAVKKKIKIPLLEEVYYDEIEDGLSVQMMHIGSYDDEVASFQKMKDYIDSNHLNIKTLVHREIYLSDVRRVIPEKRKTILRYQVEKS